jgi:hypothetical protein
MKRREFIAAMGAAALGSRCSKAFALPTSDGIYGDVAEAVLDLARITDPSTKGYTRYLTLSGLPPDYDFDSAYAGLSFWVNSLSAAPRVKPPRQVNKTLFALDLRDYQWSIDAWFALTQVDGYYYYPGSVILRGDFFAYITGVTTRSQSYYDFLYGFKKAPKTATELRDRFRVRLDDVRFILKEVGVPIRAGESGVARSNRLIREARTAAGHYWQTFDTKTSAGNQNLPANLNLAKWHFDAGEIIFSLPNGLHGFLLVDAKEKRIEIADGEVVKAPFLHNGWRCVDCHRSQGILMPKAFVPEWAKVGVDFQTKNDYDQKTKDWFEAFYHGDPNGIEIRESQERYQNAIVECWSTAGKPGDTIAVVAEKIVSGFLALKEWYQKPLSLQQACHELGYLPAVVQRALQDHKTTNLNLPALGADFAHVRDDWESNGFRQLRAVLKQGGY